MTAALELSAWLPILQAIGSDRVDRVQVGEATAFSFLMTSITAAFCSVTGWPSAPSAAHSLNAAVISREQLHASARVASSANETYAGNGVSESLSGRGCSSGTSWGALLATANAETRKCLFAVHIRCCSTKLAPLTYGTRSPPEHRARHFQTVVILLHFQAKRCNLPVVNFQAKHPGDRIEASLIHHGKAHPTNDRMTAPPMT